MVIVTFEPAGITTRPVASFTSLATVPVTLAPGLSVFDEISRSTVAETIVPDPSAKGAGAGAGLGAGFGAGLGLATGLGAGLAGAAATGVAAAWSFSRAEESTGSRCRSR